MPAFDPEPFDPDVFDIDGVTHAAVSVDHLTLAVKRLPQQFKDRESIKAMVRLLCTPAPALEQAFLDLVMLRAVDTAEKTILDLIGKIIGQPRNGTSDDIYRRHIKARIIARRSHGLLETLIRIARLVVDEPTMYVEVRQMNIATVLIRLNDVAVTDEIADLLFTFLRVAVSAGVRIDLESSPEDPATWFEWDLDGHGWDESNFLDLRSNTI